ncbi:MAG TPA: hypothetical protein VFU10_07375, partial [Gaiellaceae bacterium]|nr:hypothetical protein [Gaiellaceae bacterium]
MALESNLGARKELSDEHIDRGAYRDKLRAPQRDVGRLRGGFAARRVVRRASPIGMLDRFGRAVDRVG